MLGVPFTTSMIRQRATCVAGAAGVLSALACRTAAPATSPHPVANPCAQHAAVALYRGRVARGTSVRTGALVVRLAAADSLLAPPSGPVRVMLATAAASQTAAAETHVLTVSAAGVAHSGALPAARYVVEATGRGFQPGRLTLSVRPGATDTVRFRLVAACARRASR